MRMGVREDNKMYKQDNVNAIDIPKKSVFSRCGRK